MLRVSLPPSLRSASRVVSRRVEIIGSAIQATKNEMTRLAAIVSDSAWKKAPVTPDRNARGANIIMVAAEETARGWNNFDRRRPNRLLWSTTSLFANPPHNVLGHHNGVVDDESNCCS